MLITLLYTGIFWQSRVADSERYLEIYSSVAEAELAESGVSQERVEAVSARLDGARVTVTDENAVILADSAGEHLIGQSRADRAEFAAAMESGEGSVTRESATLGTDMLYYCRALEVGGETCLLRVGVAMDSVFAVLGDALPTVVFVSGAGHSLLSALFLDRDGRGAPPRGGAHARGGALGPGGRCTQNIRNCSPSPR